MPAYTRRAIMSACIRLLEDRPISKISVKDIVEACGINRNTFYYHFQDLPSLIEAIVQEEADRIIQDYAAVASLEECLRIAIDFTLKHRRAVLHIYNSSNRDIYERYLLEICQHVVAKYVDTAIGDRDVREEDKRIIIQAYKVRMFWAHHRLAERRPEGGFPQGFLAPVRAAQGHDGGDVPAKPGGRNILRTNREANRTNRPVVFLIWTRIAQLRSNFAGRRASKESTPIFLMRESKLQTGRGQSQTVENPATAKIAITERELWQFLLTASAAIANFSYLRLRTGRTVKLCSGRQRRAGIRRIRLKQVASHKVGCDLPAAGFIESQRAARHRLRGDGCIGLVALALCAIARLLSCKRLHLQSCLLVLQRFSAPASLLTLSTS